MAAALPLSSISSLHLSLPSSSSPLKRKHHRSLSNLPSSSKTQISRRSSDSRRTITRGSTTSVYERPRIDLNVEIRKFCRKGDLKEVMRLISDSESQDHCINSDTFCSVLQLCGELGSLANGRKVHGILSSSGIQIDTLLGSKLVFMHVKCGDLREGRQVFDSSAAKDHIFPWNLLLHEYAKVGDFDESIDLFKEMQYSSVKPDSYTFSLTLKCLATSGGVSEGEQVHGSLIKLGFGAYNAVGNALIAFYSKCNGINSAIDVFDEMPDRDVISWNSLINGFVYNSLPRKGVDLFMEMWFSGMDIDSATLVSVLPACAELGILTLGKAVHGYSIKAAYSKEITVNNSLVHMYSKCWSLEDASRIFKRMAQRSVVSWTSMIQAYTRAGLFDEAIALFGEMESVGVRPDLFAITSALHACSCSRSLDQGKNIHHYIVMNRLQKNLSVANALMDMYSKCGSMEEARSVFDNITSKNIISWNTLIGGYSKNRLPNEALSLFSEMQFNMRPNSVTMACVLPAAASLSSLEKGREIHGLILRAGHFSDGYVANALVDMYAKCGALLLARRLFDQISKKDIISWTAMIAGYGMHGHGRNAIAVFKEMKGSDVEPDEVSFTVILYACSHSGLISEGWEFYNIMRNEYRIEPKLEHYACMVDLFGRAGHLAKAYEFIQSMPIEPDSTVWGALLCGCRIHRNVKLGERVAEHVFELEPENTGFYVLLANIYAEAEEWEAVRKLREKISGRGLRKNPGCSWIEIKSKIHVFVAGHKSHPQSKKIELFLREVRKRMKGEGYVPKKRHALINVDDTVKEDALCGHSEKLAIAFGILNSPKGKPIRVAKNLRVCGDCHEVAKFISKMVDREIILRDSNYFHHFEEGRCSCRGYW